MAVFIDTNVLAYSADPTSGGKQLVAQTLIERVSSTGEAVISIQVLVELFNVSTRKLKLTPAAAQAMVSAFSLWPVIDSDVGLVAEAMEWSVGHQLQIWDAMMIAAALRAGAHTLFTEDLQHGRRFGGLTVVNPFRAPV